MKLHISVTKPIFQISRKMFTTFNPYLFDYDCNHDAVCSPHVSFWRTKSSTFPGVYLAVISWKRLRMAILRLYNPILEFAQKHIETIFSSIGKSVQNLADFSFIFSQIWIAYISRTKPYLKNPFDKFWGHNFSNQRTKFCEILIDHSWEKRVTDRITVRLTKILTNRLTNRLINWQQWLYMSRDVTWPINESKKQFQKFFDGGTPQDFFTMFHCFPSSITFTGKVELKYDVLTHFEQQSAVAIEARWQFGYAKTLPETQGGQFGDAKTMVTKQYILCPKIFIISAMTRKT